MSNAIHTINVREMSDALAMAARNKVSVMFSSSPGLGKSQKIAQMADKLLDDALAKATNATDAGCLESIRGKNCIDVRLSLETPESLNGLLIPTQDDRSGQMVTKRSYDSRFLLDPKFVGILLLDEITSASPFMQSICYKLLLDRKIGDVTMPEGLVIAGAGNYAGEGLVFDMLPAVKNRMICYDVIPDAKVWLEDFAFNAGIHGSITSLIQSEPSLLYTGDQVDGADNQAFSSGRSLAVASAAIHDYDAGLMSMSFLNKTLAGTIGDVAAARWSLHYEFGSKLPSSQDIIDGKNPEMKLTDAPAQFYVAYSCLSQVMSNYHKTEVEDNALLKQIDNMFLYMLNHMSDNIDLQVSLASQINSMMRSAKKRDGFQHSITNSDTTPNYRNVLQEYMKMSQEIQSFGK